MRLYLLDVNHNIAPQLSNPIFQGTCSVSKSQTTACHNQLALIYVSFNLYQVTVWLV